MQRWKVTLHYGGNTYPMKKLAYISLFLLASYAKAQIAAGDTLGSNILFYNLPDTTITPPWKSSLFYEMDVDNSGTKDLRFFVGTNSSPGFSEFIVSVYSLTNIQFVNFQSTSYVDTMAADSLISQACNWLSCSPCTLHYFQAIYIPPPGSTIDAGLYKSGDKYLGFRLNNPADTLYGWIFLNSNGASITIKSYAINTTSNNILENNNENDTYIYPNPFSSQTVLRLGTPLHNATLTVDNCFGQTVAQIKNINGQTVVLNRDNLASGLYFVRLTEGNKTIAADKLVIADR